MILVSDIFTFSDIRINLLQDVLSFKIDAAFVLVTLLSVYYLILDVFVGLTLVIQLWTFIFLANFLHGILSTWEYIAIIILCQVVGWGTQFFGHYIEGKRPALIDNIFQIFNAPYFVMIEAFFYFGYKPELYSKIKKELERRVRK